MTKPGGRVIILPFPPASLSGHNQGSWRATSAIVKRHRLWAAAATLKVRPSLSIPMLDGSDIPIRIEFIPPNRRGDRVNFPNRLKPYLDGIADALGVNDARFLPTYVFSEPQKPGAVVVTL